MEKQLTKICLSLGTIYYVSVLVYLHYLGMPPIIVGFAWLIPLVFSLIFAFGDRGIKTNMFSDIKEDYKTPVYKLEKSNWSEKVVSKYVVVYSNWDDGWAIIFPYISIFKFKQYFLEETVCISDKTHSDILAGVVSTEEVYLRECIKHEKRYLDKIAEEKAKKDNLREVNKEYYNNFKK